ncbi:MAG TPA: glycosyltransferase family 9 protein [Candidatus Omnitrophica bacterium]|nr:glycosyltransferase family 9 protein [Candidatus Omnitrophota bacterium]
MILYDRKGKDKGLKGLIKISSIVRRKAFDMSIDLQNNRTSHLIAWMGSVPRRFGYSSRKMGFLVNNKLKYLNIGAGPVEEQFRILKKAGINTIGASKRLEIWPGKEDFSYIEKILKDEWVRENQILVGINIGGSWKTKRWPLKYFARFSDMLAAKDIRVVVTGSGTESNLAEEFSRLARAKAINITGRTNITQLAALIKKCRVYVTSDSAPMHIASAMGSDFIALFGPTDPRRHFEPSDKGVFIKKEINCGPCYKSTCNKNTCMEKISVDEVYKLVMERIADS